jgi:Tfp pilus assembly protein PilE
MKVKFLSHHAAKRAAQGFTLIEMIGELAVIAILAAVLIPKVFEAINNSKINSSAMACQTVKTAVVDHYAKYGTLLSSNGTTLVLGTPGAINFDKTLLTEGFIDKTFEAKVSGDSNIVSLVAGLLVTDAVTGVNAAYDLDGNDPAVNDAHGASVVQAIITNVAEADAKSLNDRIDGTSLGSTAIGVEDLKGRVKYATPAAGLCTVRVYLTHR